MIKIMKIEIEFDKRTLNKYMATMYDLHKVYEAIFYNVISDKGLSHTEEMLKLNDVEKALFNLFTVRIIEE